jgi:GxxExxY protein
MRIINTVKSGGNKKIVDDFLYKEESYLIIEAAKEVWKSLGGFFKETVAEKALSIALENRKLKVENQKRVNIYFDNKIVGVYVPDIIVGGEIIIELKCKPFLVAEDVQQLWHYLKASKYKLGFIINFSPRGVQYKRVIYDRARKTT